MELPVTAVYDANVLYPAPLRDLLIRVAQAGLVRARWTEAIHDEWVRHVLAIPAMLFAAGHTKNDIPSVLNTYAAETGLRIDYGRELGVDRRMIRAAGERIAASLRQADEEDRAAGRPPVPLEETLLVVVGRGSSDPDANANVAKVTRMLVEGFGFGWGETLYSGVTFPLVEPGLRHAVKLGFRQIGRAHV